MFLSQQAQHTAQQTAQQTGQSTSIANRLAKQVSAMDTNHKVNIVPSQKPLFPSVLPRLNRQRLNHSTKVSGQKPLPERGHRNTPFHIDTNGNALTIPRDDVTALNLLMMGLRNQRRWVYFLRNNLNLTTATGNTLQVKVPEQYDQKAWLQKIITAGQASAIILEELTMDQDALLDIKELCGELGVVLVILTGTNNNLM